VLKDEDEELNDEYMFVVHTGSIWAQEMTELESVVGDLQKTEADGSMRPCETVKDALAHWPRVTIDAVACGSIARFINHSVRPLRHTESVKPRYDREYFNADAADSHAIGCVRRFSVSPTSPLFRCSSSHAYPPRRTSSTSLAPTSRRTPSCWCRITTTAIRVMVSRPASGCGRVSMKCAVPESLCCNVSQAVSGPSSVSAPPRTASIRSTTDCRTERRRTQTR
jgi:hypothetical protein